jgi:ribose transport system substrate-binding protein
LLRLAWPLKMPRMTRRRDVSGLLIFAVAALATGACKSKESAPTMSASAPTPLTSSVPEPRTYVIGMSQCNLGEPWRVQMNADIEQAAKKHPSIKLVMKDAQNDSLRQRAQVEELAALGVDLLLVSPKESAPLTKPIAEVFKKGTPVIVLDRAVDGDAFTTFIGADNRKIGKEAGKWVASALGGKGAVVELKGLMTSTPGRDRHEGFREALALDRNKDLKVVFDADTQWLEPNARKEMESALAAHKKIDLVYAHNDPGAHGAYLAAKAAGRERQMKFVGIDALPHEGVRYVKEGILDATFAYPTGGAEAIELAVSILAGKQAPKKVTLGTRLYTKENVDKGGEPIE